MPNKFEPGDKAMLDSLRVVRITQETLEEGAEGTKYLIETDTGAKVVVDAERLTFYLED